MSLDRNTGSTAAKENPLDPSLFATSIYSRRLPVLQQYVQLGLQRGLGFGYLTKVLQSIVAWLAGERRVLRREGRHRLGLHLTGSYQCRGGTNYMLQ